MFNEEDTHHYPTLKAILVSVRSVVLVQWEKCSLLEESSLGGKMGSSIEREQLLTYRTYFMTSICIFNGLSASRMPALLCNIVHCRPSKQQRP